MPRGRTLWGGYADRLARNCLSEWTTMDESNESGLKWIDKTDFVMNLCRRHSGHFSSRAFSPLPACGWRYIFCGTSPRSLGAAISGHPVLWSPDFPPSARGGERSLNLL